MKEVKDPEIKLFGKKIALLENGKRLLAAGGDSSGDSGCRVSVYSGENSSGSDSGRSKSSRVEETEAEVGKETEKQELADKGSLSGDCCKMKPQVKDQPESPNSKVSSESDENSNASTFDEDSQTKQSLKTDGDDTTNSQQNVLKKPDKILPCPRCASMDTKFCYYNNYNIDQPRHFCKSCQRYWTAGGTMRNVPVGAGRRKNKNSASLCRHITISEAIEDARIDSPNGFHHLNFKPDGTVLSFGSGSGSPLYDSMASVLHLADNKAPNASQNGFRKIDTGISVPLKGAENGEDRCSGSSVTTSNSMVEGAKNGLQQSIVRQMNGFTSPVPCLPGVPWPFPWNSAVPVPAIFPSGFPMPFYPTPFWNCTVTGAWSFPWMPPVSNTEIQKDSGSGTNSPTLGKRSRDNELPKPNNPEDKESPQKKNAESSILVPKILRIDDPDEAAKSSIWTTLGIKYDAISREGLFKALQPKGDQKKHLAATSPVLQANPAALSRSVNFQESA